MSKDALRKKQLMIIHVGKKELGLDDELYRDMLESLTGKRSASDMTSAEREKVIAQMSKDSNGKITKTRTVAKPSPEKSPMLKKVYKLLYVVEEPISYAETTLKNMFGADAPDRLEWATGEQLHKLIAALEYHKKRQGL